MIRLVPLTLLMGLLFAVDKEGKEKTKFDVTGIVIGENGERLKKVKLTILMILAKRLNQVKQKRVENLNLKK